MTVDDLLAIQPVIPVITIERVEDARPLAKTLSQAGLRVLEVTLRTQAALACLREMASIPSTIVGAGTVLSAHDVMLAREAGATFIVTPGLSAATVAAAREAGVAILPGVATATELMAGLDLGVTRFKFFPAEQAGGRAMLDALRGPFGQVRFCPTGGITPNNAAEFLALPQVKVVGGSWLTPADRMEAGDWAGITELARAASALRRA